MSVQIEIDKATQRRLNESLNGLEKLEGDFMDGIIKVLWKIKGRAQLRLTQQGHIVTSRLKNSIYVKNPQGKTQNPARYSDNEGRKFDASLSTVNLDRKEGAVGTNVEYAGKIERLDSYLYWATKNIDKDISEEMKRQVKENQRKYKR